MSDTATIVGPVVRMCEDKACHGWQDCPSARRDRAGVIDRTLGISERVPDGTPQEDVLKVLAQELAIGAPRDADGNRYFSVPDGCEFRVHACRTLTDLAGPWEYVAYYSGPPMPIREILSGPGVRPYPGDENWAEAAGDRLAEIRGAANA